MAYGEKEQWNSIQSSEIDPCIYEQIIFWQSCKINSVEKEVFSTNGVWTGYPYAKKPWTLICTSYDMQKCTQKDQRLKCKI